MREILFRGKRLDNGEWVESKNLLQSTYAFSGAPVAMLGARNVATIEVQDGNPHIVTTILTEADALYYKVDPASVGQYTGLEDKNGKRIFEGDICRFREWRNGDMCWVGKVHWAYQQFVISGGRNKECDTPFELAMSRFVQENIEVTGNIHDNPEQLEGGSE